MKHSFRLYATKASLFIATLLLSVITFAQDTTLATTTTTSSATSTEKTWYMEPWAWVLGGIILVVIIILATRGSSNTTSADKVTVTRTVERDTDTV
ncbi:MAG: hypothetical protein LH615_05125 [Ferruginibacter sp.]|nr:hypothetical protein [Ferruginibacter sp.]